MKKFIIGIVVILLLLGVCWIAYNCSMLYQSNLYYGTAESEKKMKEIEEYLEKDEKGLIPSISNIEIKTLYLKPREYGNMQVIGELKNNHTISVGVELQATAYDKQGRIIDVIKFWPASIRNIPAEDIYPYKHHFSVKEVYRATIRVIGVEVWD